ncbi:hypothetical protein MTO96_028606 [Rhipicephalus appendiculatus]
MSEKPRRRYRQYLEPGSSVQVPRQTLANAAKRAKNSSTSQSSSHFQDDASQNSTSSNNNQSARDGSSHGDSVNSASFQCASEEPTQSSSCIDEVSASDTSDSETMDCSLEDPDDNCANDPDNNCANDPDNDCANDPDDNCANDPDDNCANDDASGSDAPNDFSEYFAKLSEETLPHQRTTKAQALLLVLAYIVTAGLTWAQVRGSLILLNTLFGSVKYLYCGHLAADRSHGRVMEAMRKAQGQEAAVEGFKGPSPLLGGEEFDLDNKLQTSIQNSLKTQLTAFFDEGIGKLVPHYGKCLNCSGV